MYGSFIMEGAKEEDDYDPVTFVKSTEIIPYGYDNFSHHFWDCDISDENNSGLAPVPLLTLQSMSALAYARIYWQWAIDNYNEPYGQIEFSYYYLGRIAHLLADMSVPAHVHLDRHPPVVNPDSYEAYITDNYFQWSYEDANFIKNKNISFESIDAIDDLFWNLAQRAQFFPSDDCDGNEILNYYSASRLSNHYDIFFGDFNSISRPTRLGYFGYNLGKENCKIIAKHMMPLAILYTADLYRLFWGKTHPRVTIKNLNHSPYQLSRIFGKISINAAVTNKEWIKDVRFQYSTDTTEDNEKSWNLIGVDNTSSDSRSIMFDTSSLVNKKISIKATATAKNNKESSDTVEVIVSAPDSISNPPTVTKSLRVSNASSSSNYYTGQTLNASFSLRNNSSVPIYLKNLITGGRLVKQSTEICPNNICPDFSKVSVTLNPGASFEYKGTLKLTYPGHYHFFIGYENEDGQWNTSLPYEPGCERTFDINVIDPPPAVSLTYDAKRNTELSSPSGALTVRPGDEISFAAVMTNLCNFDWRNYLSADHYVELRSVDQNGNPAASYVYPGQGWIDSYRVGSQSASIVKGSPTNENAWFIFKGKIPATATVGTQGTVYFKLYHKDYGYFGEIVSFTFNIHQSYTAGTKWTFNNNTTQGWKLTHDITDYSFGPSYLIINPGPTDPYIDSPELNIDPDQINYIKVVGRNFGSRTDGYVYIKKEGWSYYFKNNRNLVGFTFPNTANSETIIIPLTKADFPDVFNNDGHNITQIRIDPVGQGVPANGNDNIFFESIETGKDAQGPQIEILFPTGGSTLRTDSVSAIQWKVNDSIDPDGAEKVSIYYREGSGDYTPIVKDYSNEGVYLFKFPQTPNALDLKICASDKMGNSNCVISDKFYTTNTTNQPPSVSLTSPPNNTIIVKGILTPLVFSAIDDSGEIDYIKITYSYNNIDFSPLVDAYGNSGGHLSGYTKSFDWKPLSTADYIRIKVSAFDKQGKEGYVTHDFKIVEQSANSSPPGVPSIYDSKATYDSGSFTLRWAPVSNAGSYTIKETYNSNSVILSTPNTYYSFTNKSNGTYYYKVKAVNQNGESDWSAPVERTVCIIPNVPPDKPYLLSPMNNAGGIPPKGGILFSWSNGDPDNWQNPDSKILLGKSTSSLYTIQDFGSSNAFNNTLMYYGELEPSTTYYWKLIARDDDGDETEGDFSYFKTAAKLSFDSPIFTEATQSASLLTEYSDKSRGIAVVDINGDGNLDIFAVCDKALDWDIHPLQLYLGDGNAHFTEAFNSFPSNPPLQGRGVAFADYDRDNDMDLIVSIYPKSVRLYRNDGNGLFTDVTDESGIASAIEHGGAEMYPSWADINEDGYPDLFLGAYISSINLLLLNNQNGTFTDVTDSAGINPSSQSPSPFILGSTWADFDNDGDLDLAASGPGGGIFYNNGDNTFSKKDDCGPIANSTTVFAGDFNNDGWIDLYFVSDGSGYNSDGALAYVPDVLYKNRGDGTFENITQSSGLPVSLTSHFGGTWVDYDNDGWLDLAAGKNLFRNMGDGTFAEVTGSVGIMLNDSVGGVVAFDANGDGSNDLLYSTQNNRQFYLGGSTSNNWIKVKLKGNLSDTFGVGSQIRVQAQNNFSYRTPSSGTGFGDQNPMVQHIGVGNAQKVNIRVRWLSGIVDELFDVDVNQTVTIVEGTHTDTIPPSKISNLTVYPKSSSEIVLAWTAPGDDVNIREATAYDIRYYTASIDDSNWNLATKIGNIPLPLDTGMTQSVIIKGLNPDTKYFVAIKTTDEAGNTSPISNSPFTRTTRGNKIYDLRTTVVTTDRVDLAWTVPDVMIKSYEIAYYTDLIDQSNWSNATKVTFSGEPGLPGDTDHISINGLLPGTAYYFSIKMGTGNNVFSEPSKNLKTKTLSPITNILDVVGEVDIGANLQGNVPFASGGDLNGDGINDLVITKSVSIEGKQKTELSIYFLNQNGMANQPNFTISGDSYLGFYCPPQLSDLNGDGFNDLIVSEPGKYDDALFPGKVYVYYGGPQFDTNADVILTGSGGIANSLFGSAFAISDFNLDGINDIAVCERLENTTEIKIYYGSTSILDNEPDKIISPLEDLAVFTGGGSANLNGDDYPDMIFWNGPYFLFILSKEDGKGYDYYLFRKTNSGRNILSDFNDDGYTDIAYFDWNNVGVIFGGKSADWYASPKDDIFMYNAACGNAPLGVADINGDGISDLLVGDMNDKSIYNGSVKIYLGGSDFDGEYDKLVSYEGINELGIYLTGIGDITEDSFGEFIIGGGNGKFVILKGEDIPKRTDTIPPNKIVDLKAQSNKTGEISLIWTSPGDDGNVGTAAYYEIRYTVVDNPYWDIYPNYYYTPSNPLFPQVAGKSEILTIKGLAPNTDYKFIIISLDDFGNTSEKSNIASAKVLSGIEIVEKWQMDAATIDQIVDFDSHIYTNTSLGDVNGDGYDDFPILSVEWGQKSLLQIYYGSPIWDDNADFSLAGNNDLDSYISNVSPLGDTNGDGFNDFYIYWPNESYFKGGEFISPVGDGKSDWQGGFGRVGDVNGDGYEDFVGSFNTYFAYDPPIGEVRLFLGGNTFDGNPDYLLHQGGTAAWKSLGDINGDGFADLAISSGGVVSIYCGRSNFSSSPTLVLTYPLDDTQDSGYGRSIEGIGDINGDGFDDFAVGAPFVNKVFIYYGRPNITGYPDLTLNGIKGGEYFGNKIIKIGDINNDGKQDFSITETLNSDVDCVYLGGEAQSTSPIYVFGTNDLDGESFNDNDRNFLDVLNFNGDNTPDLLLFGDAKNPKGRVHIYNFHFLDSDSDGILDINDPYPLKSPPIFSDEVTPQDLAQGVTVAGTLSWQVLNPGTNSLSYNVYLGLSPNDMSMIASSLSENTYSFTDNPLDYNGVYYWKVVVRDSAGQEVVSKVHSFTTEPLSKPDKCANVQAAGDVGGIHISWEIPKNTAIEGCYIERKDPLSSDFVLVGAANPEEKEFTDTQNLLPHRELYYRVSAYNSNGVGASSDPCRITIQNTSPLAFSQNSITFKNKSETITLSGKDADGDNLTYEVLDNPSHGRLSGTTPHLTYTPDEDYSGPDSFNFRVKDGVEGSEKATVNIDIVSVSQNVIKENEKQEIPLNIGWNLISFQINKCFYDGSIPSSTVSIPGGVAYEEIDSLAEWLSNDIASPIRDASAPDKAGKWQRIISFDKDGAHLLDKDVPPSANTLHYLSVGYGYWINMNEPGMLIVEGQYAPLDTKISLLEGWNLIGFIPAQYCYGTRVQENIYPYMNGYYTQEDNITYCYENPTGTIFAGIDGEYRRIVSFDPFNGAMIYDTELPLFANTLHYLGPKYGYWIKALKNIDLVFPIDCGQ